MTGPVDNRRRRDGLALHLPTTGAHQDQWDFALSAFTPDRAWAIGREADRPQSNQLGRLPFVEHPAELPLDGAELVILAPAAGRYVRGVEPLDVFEHPPDAVYLLGDDKTHLQPDVADLADHLVYVPTDTDHELYSWMAYAVTMWDRRSKLDG